MYTRFYFVIIRSAVLAHNTSTVPILQQKKVGRLNTTTNTSTTIILSYWKILVINPEASTINIPILAISFQIFISSRGGLMWDII